MNTHPNTPFGKFFEKIGVWHPTAVAAIEDLYNKLHADEQIAVKTASEYIAIVNANLSQTPDFIFNIIQSRFPAVTKEAVTEAVNKLNAEILHIKMETPDSFEDAIAALQTYLSKYQGNTWIAITRAAVAVLTDVLLKGGSPITIIETVLEYVYRTFIKDKI